MSSPGTSKELGFRALVFSDLARYRTDANPSWLKVFARCLTVPGLIASIILRAQQCLHRAGHLRAAAMLRSVGVVLIGADFGPGMQIGAGLMIAHPVGVNIGYGLTIGDNVTFAAGVVAAARYYDLRDDQEFATICDGATIGAHAVLVGGVRVGENAVVGANSVVLSDVPDGAVVFGSPARRVGSSARDSGTSRPDSGAVVPESPRTGFGYQPDEHYDRVTEAWRLLLGDELHYGVFVDGDEPLSVATAELTRRMVEAAHLAPGLDVLDVGCGSGAPACRLVADFDVRVVGVTTSAVGVAAARDRASRAGLAGATFEQRDGMDNGFPDESFDRVWVLESAHLMRERERLIAECARVLRPGGRLVLCDLVRHREIPFQEVRARREEFVTLRTAFGDAHFEPLDLYASIAEAHGLVVDRADDLTAPTLPTFDRWRANARQHRAEVTAALGSDGLAAFERSCDILEAFWRDGTFGYGLIAASKSKPSTG